MARRTLFVGRSRTNDVRLADRSVSRRHLELTVADDGRIYLTDCGSRFGTFVRSENGWRRTRQGFVGVDDILRLGDHQIAVRDMLRRAEASPAAGGGTPVEDKRPSGPVSRDPRTGEVVRKR